MQISLSATTTSVNDAGSVDRCAYIDVSLIIADLAAPTPFVEVSSCPVCYQAVRSHESLL